MRIKNYFLSLAAVALVAGFASCSNDDIVPGTDPVVPEPETQIGQDGVAYLKLGINLGQDASGRANDEFADGEGYEYAVENATLIIFSGAAEADEDAMKMRSAYDLAEGAWNLEGTTIDQITTTRVITTKVITQNIEAGEKVYAYVVLNKHKFFQVGKENAADEFDMILNADGTKLDDAQKLFGNFRKMLLDEQDKNFSNQSFTMTNMPHLHKGGSTVMPDAVKPWVLMEINPDRVYPTLAKANADSSLPSVEIDVERVVAKVELNVNTAKYTQNQVTKYYEGVMQAYDEQDQLVNTDPEISLAIIGWFIDNTNKYAYLSRNSENPVGDTPFSYLQYKASASGSPYRMVAKDPVHVEAMGGNFAYRTYWGIDPNYHDGVTSGLTTEAGKVVNNNFMIFDEAGHNVGGRLRAPGSHYYCAENTFDVEHQTVENTTRVIVAVQFNGGEGFYTLSSEPNNILSKAQLIEKIKKVILGRVNVDNWLGNAVVAHLKEGVTTLTPEQQMALIDLQVTDGKTATGDYTGKATVAVSLSQTGLAAVVNPASLQIVSDAWGELQTDQENFVDRYNKQLSFYYQGVAYYQALIRHFNDTETPWTPDATMTNVTESIYNSNSEADYLGRYGVLRNNWYNLTIDAITHIGSSTIPERTKEPDDTVEQFLKVKINVMPWVKRTQNVIL